MTRSEFSFLILLVLIIFTAFIADKWRNDDKKFLEHRVDPQKQSIQFYWKDEKGQRFTTLGRLREWMMARGDKLVFATNGGMYEPNNSPVGLYIENKKVLHPLNTKNSAGNFYLKPNGVFYITGDKKGHICTTEAFKYDTSIKYATQSGPMLVIDGKLHSAFQKNSANVNIRNGVGILPDEKIIFVMSKSEINLFDFATYFQKAGCKFALHLDGFVSRTYLPAKNWIQTDGNFAVIIAETAKE